MHLDHWATQNVAMFTSSANHQLFKLPQNCGFQSNPRKNSYGTSYSPVLCILWHAVFVALVLSGNSHAKQNHCLFRGWWPRPMWLRSCRLDDQIWRGCESRLWLFEIAANIFQNEETLAGNLQTQTIDSVWMVSVGPNHHQKKASPHNRPNGNAGNHHPNLVRIPALTFVLQGHGSSLRKSLRLGLVWA